MYKDVNILIVCTGNIFRSASAEYLFKQYLDDIGEERFNVDSAGIKGDIEKTMDIKTEEELRERGIDAADHESTKLTEDHVEWADTIISMADYHQQKLYEEYGAYSYLYTEFTDDETKNIDDIGDKYHDVEPSREQVEQHIADTIAYLENTTPTVIENLQYRHFLFREFALGDRDSHMNGAPFRPLLENEEALAFLSLDIPETLDNHALVIPREKHQYIDDIPMDTKQDMFELADQLGSVFTEEHAGYNVVVNNGGAAGQQIFHTHIHVIPREPADNVDIEHWHHTTVDSKKHETLRSSLSESLNGNH
jgi:histidine triad (HIT) family protein